MSTQDDDVLINEIAPRVHNSGHLTINAYNVSQFENHVRAVCGLEQIPIKKISNAKMINLIGDEISSYRKISKLNDKESAEGIIESRETMYPIYQIHYLEEFVKRPPRDIRAIMVGDKIVAAIYRKSEHWKTNMALGGTAEPCKVTQEMEEMCIKAKNAVQGDIVGVDLMESEEKGLVVHEVNNTTEYKNTVRVCEVDIPALMLDYALKVEK